MNLYRIECVLLCRAESEDDAREEFNKSMELLAPFGLIEDVHIEGVEEMENGDD